jgi:hypothetical protein
MKNNKKFDVVKEDENGKAEKTNQQKEWLLLFVDFYGISV